ncbi:helix-turn-helix transcriptional regulator [Micromonospora sp. B11E3]|uniref:helix-turn-helix domain-containing protein n=1 Tax=Micromonospora sp. B11E3 TaxID=3153562 RepID=UPI00325C8E70
MKNGVEFLVGELRAARVARGLSQDEFGKLINYSGTHVGNVESGQRPLKVDYVKAVDQALQTGGIYQRLFEKMGAPIWLREWIEDEQRATSLRWYEPAWVPGILQTEEYARTTLAGELLRPDDVDRLVGSRLGRQALLHRDPPLLLTVVLDEAVLRRTAEHQRTMMTAQFEHLLACAELPHVQIHVVPSSVGLYGGLGGPFVIAGLPDGGRVACADGQLEPQITDRPEDIATLEHRWERIRGDALPRQESLNRIKEAASWT